MGACVGTPERIHVKRAPGTVPERRFLCICLNYDKNIHPWDESIGTLTSIMDGDTMMSLARNAGITDITWMRDDLPQTDPMFPSKGNILKAMKEIGRRCAPDDVFIFHYSGHGVNVPDCPPLDESDGEDEAFVIATPNLDCDADELLVDDLFTESLKMYFTPGVQILVLTDCCHSGTVVDVESSTWEDGHCVIAIAATQDDQCDSDTGHGGALTIGMKDSMEIMTNQNRSVYHVQDIIDHLGEKVENIGKAQDNPQQMNVQHVNLDPEEMQWPFIRAWSPQITMP